MTGLKKIEDHNNKYKGQSKLLRKLAANSLPISSLKLKKSYKKIV